jgi:putative ferrous iron transport protein C
MILADLKTYLIQCRRADLTDLSARFDIDCDALRGMLEAWVARGRVRRLESSGTKTCKTCCGCELTGPEIYEWVSD